MGPRGVATFAGPPGSIGIAGPSGPVGFADPAGAVTELLRGGVTALVHKNGADGARYHDASGTCFVPAFEVDEIDPTGAGDCFGGAFTALWLRGTPPRDALALACAAGALAVTRRGPMEGVSDLATLERFMRANGEAPE